MQELDKVLREEVNALFIKYHEHLMNTCRRNLRNVGAAIHYSDDILQDAVIELCLLDNSVLQKIIDQEKIGNRYFFNYLRKIVHSRVLDYSKKRKSLNIDQIDPLGLDSSNSGDPNLSEKDYNKLREVSCNIREDHFTNISDIGTYAPITIGWVSGWVHSYVYADKRYAYWQYSAYYGSRCKGENPKRIKTSSSRHDAYMALCKYNNSLLL